MLRYTKHAAYAIEPELEAAQESEENQGKTGQPPRGVCETRGPNTMHLLRCEEGAPSPSH